MSFMLPRCRLHSGLSTDLCQIPRSGTHMNKENWKAANTLPLTVRPLKVFLVADG
ncbi:hypothetical protein CHS0354_041677, partial [Potamilus streckersoni]